MYTYYVVKVTNSYVKINLSLTKLSLYLRLLLSLFRRLLIALTKRVHFSRKRLDVPRSRYPHRRAESKRITNYFQ